LFAFPFAFVGPVECNDIENFGSHWHTIAADFQTFLNNNTNENFDDVQWMLTITQVAPE
jgi:hypothetical protein